MGLRRRSPQSIFSADTAPRRKRRLPGRVVAGVAAAAIALAGGATYLLTSGRPAGNPANSALSRPAVTKSASHVDVLIDGWTVKTLSGLHLGYSNDNGTAQTLPLRPVTDDDIAELLKTTPDIVTHTLARLATVDSGLTCAASGCHDAAGSVDAHWLVDPTKIPGYGKSYAGYGITHGLYVASVPTTKAGQTQIVADGYDGYFVSPVPNTSADDSGAKPTPDLWDGYLRGRYLIGAGLGRFFVPNPAWLGDGSGRDVQRFSTVQPETPGDAQTLDPTSPVTFTHGLAPVYPQAAQLGETQLTYMTSPTTGCGTGVLCVPGTVTPKVDAQARTASYVCGSDNTHVAVAVLDDVRLTVDYTSPTHQFGAWGGRTPDTFDGHDKGRGMFTGTPPLATGSTQLRWATVGFFDADPLRLRVISGETDSGPGADLTTPATLDDMLTKIRLDGQLVHRCS